MKKILFSVILAAAALVSCTSQKKAEPEAETSKVLVLYYSQTGTTQAVAEAIQQQLGADIEAIEVENPYSGTYQETIVRCQQEMSAGEAPAVKPLQSNLDNYETIFLGYPVWFGTYALPVQKLLQEIDLSGKTGIPFCTFGSGGIDETVAQLRAELPGADVRDGYGVRTARVDKAAAEVERFLIASGLKEGEAPELPEYSEQKPVTEAEALQFDEACGSYQFPLGTPVTCGSRQTPYGVEYLYFAETPGMDGTISTSKIYILVAGGKAEFTKVVR